MSRARARPFGLLSKAAAPTSFPLANRPFYVPRPLAARGPLTPARAAPELPTPKAPPAPKFDLANDTRIRRALGRGVDQPLAGTRLFDSTTVKPRMSVADYWKHRGAALGREAWDSISRNLATKYQMPTWADRHLYPVDWFNRALHAADKNRLLHPFVTGARQVAYLGNTVPLGLALPQRAAHALGRSRLASGLTGARRGILYGPTAAAVASAPWAMRENAAGGYWQALDAAGVDRPAADAAYEKFREGYFPHAWNLRPTWMGGEDSALADAHRRLGRKLFVPRLRQTADNMVHGTADVPEEYRQTSADVMGAVRRLTPAGLALQTLAGRTARPLDRNTLLGAIRETAGETGPQLAHEVLSGRTNTPAYDFYRKALPDNPAGTSLASQNEFGRPVSDALRPRLEQAVGHFPATAANTAVRLVALPAADDEPWWESIRRSAPREWTGR